MILPPYTFGFYLEESLYARRKRIAMLPLIPASERKKRAAKRKRAKASRKRNR